MMITISKSDYYNMLALIDKCTAIVQEKNPTTIEYNYARRLKLISKKIVRNN